MSYRASARDAATSLALKGWVRNLTGGDVEAVAEGDGAGIEAFLAWCRRGPPEAKVTGVDVGEAPDGPLGAFEVRR